MRNGRLLLILSATLLAGSIAAVHEEPAIAARSQPSRGGAVQAGKQAFVAQGCYLCHGYVGQGGEGTGPALAGLKLGDAAISAYIRHPSGTMPPFSEKLLPPAQLDTILAYIHSLTVGRPPSDIPLLASYVANAPQPTAVAAMPPAPPAVAGPDGAALFATNCAACHGANLEGGMGPDLRQEGATHSAAQIAQTIMSPPQGMPKLYPDPLKTSDVDAIAAFVHGAAEGSP